MRILRWMATAAAVLASVAVSASALASSGTNAGHRPALARHKLPVFIAGSYRGRRPDTIAISGDSGNIVTDLRWSRWSYSSASATGISNVQDCVPNCAEGKETPVRTSIVLKRPSHGYFTELVERRQGATAVFHYTPGHLPDDWPGFAS